MAATHATEGLEGRASKETKNEIEIADADEKHTGYRMSEAEIPLEQRKEEARVLCVSYQSCEYELLILKQAES
jgi:RNase P/RNase MRP subunit p29